VNNPAVSRIENSSGGGFDLLWAGPNATNVPREASIVDITPSDVVFSDASQWKYIIGGNLYGQSGLVTTTPGASLSFAFDGVAVWYDVQLILYSTSVLTNLCLRYYCNVREFSGFFKVSIDGSTPERLKGKETQWEVAQQMLWSRTDLSSGKHTITLTQDDDHGRSLELDFFRFVISGIR